MSLEDDFGSRYDNEDFVEDKIRQGLIKQIEHALQYNLLDDTERLSLTATLFLLKGTL